MAGIASWFSFETKEQRRKKELRYRKKMFPFGDQQHKWEIDMINSLWPERKDTRTIQYEVLVLREAIYDCEHQDDEDEVDPDAMTRADAIALWEQKKRLDSKITKDDESIIKALAILELDSVDFDSLPSVEQIRAHRF